MARRNNRALVTLIALVWRHPKLLLAVLGVWGGWYAYEVTMARPSMLYMGEPKAVDWNPMHWTRTLRNEGFILGYSDLRGNPLWVCYRLEKIPAKSPRYKRPERFSQDWRALNFVDHASYTGSGFDRGHMAPNYAISRLHGKEAQLDTFKMTNITPQKPKLNQETWRQLEELEADRFTKKFKTLWVYTGPVFDKDKERLRSDFRVEIPDAFYKIYVGLNPGERPKTIAFVIPQDVYPGQELAAYLVSIDDVEIITGLDFLSELEDSEEAQLEQFLAKSLW